MLLLLLILLLLISSLLLLLPLNFQRSYYQIRIYYHHYLRRNAVRVYVTVILNNLKQE